MGQVPCKQGFQEMILKCKTHVPMVDLGTSPTNPQTNVPKPPKMSWRCLEDICLTFQGTIRHFFDISLAMSLHRPLEMFSEHLKEFFRKPGCQGTSPIIVSGDPLYKKGGGPKRLLDQKHRHKVWTNNGSNPNEPKFWGRFELGPKDPNLGQGWPLGSNIKFTSRRHINSCL